MCSQYHTYIIYNTGKIPRRFSNVKCCVNLRPMENQNEGRQKAEGNTLAYKYSNVKLAYIQWHRCMDLYSINAPNYVFFKT